MEEEKKCYMCGSNSEDHNYLPIKGICRNPEGSKRKWSKKIVWLCEECQRRLRLFGVDVKEAV